MSVAGLLDGWQAWVGFNVFVLAMLALDLGVFHRKAHEVSVKEALSWSAVWVALALCFNVLVWKARGPQAGLEFLTGYLVEKSLSVDNIFVFVMVFSAFAIPRVQQHRLLFWGVLGALVMRAAFIAAGAALITRFHWVLYVFGGLLAATGVKMLLARQPEADAGESRVVTLVRRWVPASPPVMALVSVEAADLVFAVDSIPAVFAVTRDPFIVYTSNIFAILGLRSLYFALSGVIERLKGLKTGLAFVLLFVGAKMLAMDLVKVPPAVSLGVIAALLSIPVAFELIRPRLRIIGTTSPEV